MIEVDGEIVYGNGGSNFLFGSKTTGSEDIQGVIQKIKDDFTIRGVLLRVNSPGGSMLGSNQILSAIDKLKESGLPVYASFGNVAASGGYYVAMGADKIFANPATLTGSIGVVSVHQNFSELNSMLDVRREIIKTGRYMDLMDPNSETSTEDMKIMTDFQRKFYEKFTQKLAERRHLTPVEVNHIAQGQIILGEQAQQLKIVDEIGNFYTAVDELAKKVRIKKPELVYYRKPSPIFPFLMDGLAPVGQFLGVN